VADKVFLAWPRQTDNLPSIYAASSILAPDTMKVPKPKSGLGFFHILELAYKRHVRTFETGLGSNLTHDYNRYIVCSQVMKTGPEFIGSRISRQMDIGLAVGILAPLALVARAGLKLSYALDGHGQLTTVDWQERLGQNNVAFCMAKLSTRMSVVDDDPSNFNNRGIDISRPINLVAAWCLQKSIDETEQWRNILRGDMKACGRRPLHKLDRDYIYDHCDPKLVARHAKLVIPTPPGIFGTFANAAHKGLLAESDIFNYQLECEIEDVKRASLGYHRQLVLNSVRSLEHYIIAGNATAETEPNVN
jgi:lipopolysaccharide/colanic/teichoic acid biosynthesis glycosyltransferase